MDLESASRFKEEQRHIVEAEQHLIQGWQNYEPETRYDSETLTTDERFNALAERFIALRRLKEPDFGLDNVEFFGCAYVTVTETIQCAEDLVVSLTAEFTFISEAPSQVKTLSAAWYYFEPELGRTEIGSERVTAANAHTKVRSQLIESGRLDPNFEERVVRELAMLEESFAVAETIKAQQEAIGLGA